VSSWEAMDCDVIVVGGGPAGATCGAILAREGLSVVLAEEEHFPRHHVGESLQPATMELLDQYLGLAPVLGQQGYARKYGAVYVWGETREPWSILFDSRLEAELPDLDEAGLLGGGYTHAWQVLRASFDHLLLQEAVKSGADVRQGVRVHAPLVEGDRVVGVRLQSGDELRSRIVVDASGQRCLIGRSFGFTSDVADLKATATYAYYDGARRHDPGGLGLVHSGERGPHQRWRGSSRARPHGPGAVRSPVGRGRAPPRWQRAGTGCGGGPTAFREGLVVRPSADGRTWLPSGGGRGLFRRSHPVGRRRLRDPRRLQREPAARTRSSATSRGCGQSIARTCGLRATGTETIVP
jgi:hypothetical protein